MTVGDLIKTMAFIPADTEIGIDISNLDVADGLSNSSWTYNNFDIEATRYKVYLKVKDSPKINYGTITFMRHNDDGEVTPYTRNVERYIVEEKDYIVVSDDFANIWKLHNIFDTWYEVDEPREVIYDDYNNIAVLYGRCEIMIIEKNVGCILYASSLVNIK